MSKTNAESNGGAPSPNEPLIAQQQKFIEETMAKALDEKEVDGAVYKSTVDQVELKQPSKYVGLTKEELERFVTDPFWRRLRYIFLALFWIAWIAMFAAAIIIVIISPKCPPKPQLQWYQKKMCYQIWTRSFQDSNNDGVGDLSGMADRLKQMVALKASAIWPVPLLLSGGKGGYDIIDHKTIDPEIGSMADFEHLIKVAHKNSISFIMDLPMTTVGVHHSWFNKSLAKEADFEQYFKWSDTQVDSKTYSSVPEHSGFYKHWGNRPKFPLLNYDHAPVLRAMKEVVKFWLEKGVDGFYLGEVQYMSLLDDGTPNWDKIHAYLKDFNEFIRIQSPGRNILTFTSAGFNEPDFGLSVDEFKLNMRLKSDVNYVINNELVFVNGSCGARCLHGHLQRVVDLHVANNLSWPMWEIGHPYTSRVATRMGSRSKAEMLAMLLMTLPGSINIYYGDEIGMVDSADSSVIQRNKPRTAMQWSDDANAGFTQALKSVIPVNEDYKEINVKSLSTAKFSVLKFFKRLATLRRSEDALLYGDIRLAPGNDDLLVVHATSNHSTTSYLTVLNFGGTKTYNLLGASFNVSAAGKDVTLVTATTNLASRGVYGERQAIDLQKLQLQADEGLVIKIKPSK